MLKYILLIAMLMAQVVFAQQNTTDSFEDVEDDIDKLQALCDKLLAKGDFCGVGVGTYSSKDTALQMATIVAKGDLAAKIGAMIQTTETNGRITITSTTDNSSERITGVRQNIRTDNIGKNICTIPNAGGKVSLKKTSEQDNTVEYAILINGKLSGVCIYYHEAEEETEAYAIKTGDGVRDVKVQKTYTEYNNKTKKYTAYVAVSVPKEVVNKSK